MKQMEIRYRQWGFKRMHVVHVPETWHEMSPKQFLAAVRFYQKTIDEGAFFQQFFSLSKFLLNRLGRYPIYKMAEQIEFVRDCRQPHNAFFLERLPGTDLFAPLPKLNRMSLQQYMTIDTYFNRYVLSENDKFLERMIAATYLPENVVFNLPESQVPSLFKKMPVLLNMDKSLPIVEHLEKEIKLAVFMNLMLIKNWLGGLFPYLFPSVEDTPKRPLKTKTVDWLEIFDSFVGDDVAEMKKYQAMEVMNAFRVMNRRIKNSMKK